MSPAPCLLAPLALQSPLDVFANPATAWIIIPIMIFSIPIVQALMGPANTRAKALERDKLRAMYERLALEKLDVIKTAVAMGYKQAELADLDARLEQAIGSDAMRTLLEGKQLKAADHERGSITIGVSTGGKSLG
jgi:hypothetical protein